jgi:hypothetical protein
MTGMAEHLLNDIMAREHDEKRNSVLVSIAIMAALVLAIAALVVWARAAS